MGRFKALWCATLLLLAALSAGCSADHVALGDPGAEDTATAEDLVVVQTLAPERVELPRTTTQPATVHAFYTAQIHARVTGYLAELKADIGQKVAQDDVLGVIAVPELVKRSEREKATIARLESDEKRAAAELAVAKADIEAFKAKVEQAKANIAKTEASLAACHSEFDRVGGLVREKAVAEQLLDEATKKYESARAEKTAAEAAVTAAEADLALSRARALAAEASVEVARAMTEVSRRELEELDAMMQYATLRAPFDGVVTERHVDPGDLVRNTQNGSGKDPLFVVVKMDTLRVRVSVPERDVPLVDIGDQARISLQAVNGPPLTGKVSRISGGLDEATRTMTVEIDLPNEDGAAKPGMFGQATIVLESDQPRLALPANTVHYDEQGQSSVYVVDDNDLAQVVGVTTGMDDGERVEIVAGLTGEERVVGPMLRRLKPGQKVRVE